MRPFPRPRMINPGLCMQGQPQIHDMDGFSGGSGEAGGGYGESGCVF